MRGSSQVYCREPTKSFAKDRRFATFLISSVIGARPESSVDWVQTPYRLANHNHLLGKSFPLVPTVSVGMPYGTLHVRLSCSLRRRRASGTAFPRRTVGTRVSLRIHRSGDMSQRAFPARLPVTLFSIFRTCMRVPRLDLTMGILFVASPSQERSCQSTTWTLGLMDGVIAINPKKRAVPRGRVRPCCKT